MSSSVIQVKNLVKRYGDRIAVNGADLSVLEGEIFGLLGPNGAGKSTTISILATLLAPDEGEVRICGYDLRRETAPQTGRRGEGIQVAPRGLASGSYGIFSGRTFEDRNRVRT